ncbi:hypothetical protein QBC36DRAFT_245321 [Triangularia setosa]|uniref:HMG box domain-containing protein n=1 Tax=Triangularia setosa TaxID=2587417 RepID=A0AAN7A493_9PEZI|nr:hypothetical protein QBC36DRAFT_245321 [Podospora setosa]
MGKGGGKMTEVIPSSSQQQRQPPGSQPQQQQSHQQQQQQTGPLTRSAMSAARLAGGGSIPTTSSSIRTTVGGGESATIPAARATSARRDAPFVTSAPLLPSGPSHSTRGSSFISSSPHRHNPQLGSGPVTRKRAASINTEEANSRSRIENLTLQTPHTTNPGPFHGGHIPEGNGSGQDLVCLCTPPPKIPRPRNAFILYRQAHQATIVQQNPGLANPDISKIIGENWKAEPEESKNKWKELAEAEKLRHQTQFPGYRYQPRRGNKSGAPSGRTTVPGQDPHKCPNCGGRYIATPRTPSTPFMTPTAAKQPPFSGGGGHPPPPGYPHHQQPPPTPASGRGNTQPQWGAQASGGNLYDIREDYEDAYSPLEAKRRRYNTAGNHYHALPSPPPPLHHSYSGPARASASRASMSMSNLPAPGYGSPQLPGPSSMLTRVSPGPSPLSGGSITGSMAPPPVPRPPSLSMSMSSPYSHPPSHQYPPPLPQHQPYPHPSQQQRTGSLSSVLSGGASQPLSGGEFDESLRLPPLYLSTSTTNPSTSRIPISPDNESEIGSAYPSNTKPLFSSSHLSSSSFPGAQNISCQDSKEEEVRRSVEAMVMSISYINKLQVLERISPPLVPDPQQTRQKKRGPIIAVEGVDLSLMKLVGSVIERALRQERGEFWEIKTWNATDEEPSDDLITKELAGSFSSSSKIVPGSRAGSTTPVSFRQQPAADPSPFESYLRTITKWHAKSAEIVSFVTSPQGSSPSTSHHSSDNESTTPTPRSRHPLPGHPGSQTSKSPIALLPVGFSLTLSDKFACQTPISDSYAPVDHWQWMATLWRGVVGADLVIYVKGIYQQQHQSPNSSPKGQQLQQQAGVDIKSGGLITVKIPVLISQEGSSQGEQQVVIDEKIERRLGFEVVEWVRGASWLGQGQQQQQQQQGEPMEF